MEQLDGLAASVGATACGFLFRNGHDTVHEMLCSDGYYSAGWRLFVSALVLLGFVLAWYWLGRSAGSRL